MSGAHHAAQRAIVRMLYDPGFARLVRDRPRDAGLDSEVLALVGSIDPRALRADRLRARRTLGALMEELRCASVLALDLGGSLALLERFFVEPAFFHRAVERDQPLVLAFADWLAQLAVRPESPLRSSLLAHVVEFERMQAEARRGAAPVPARAPGGLPDGVALAPGVVPRRLRADVLSVSRRVEEVLFEHALVPGMALAGDAPRLGLPREAEGPEVALVAVPLDGDRVSVVTLEDDLAWLFLALAAGPRSLDELRHEATAAGFDEGGVAATVLELLDDEMLVAATQARVR